MMTRAPSAFLGLFSLAIATSGTAAEGGSPAKFFPPSTVAYAELPNPQSLVSTIFDHPLRERIESLQPYKTAVQTPGYRNFEVGRSFIETHFAMSWREAIANFAEQGISVGFDGATNGVALIIRGKDANSMELFRDKLVDLARFGDDSQDIRSGEYRGITAHQIKKARLAIIGNRMVVTNNSDLGQAILDRLIDGEGDSLADAPRFQAARSERDAGLTAWAYVDVKAIRDSGVADQFYQDQIDNPVLELLVGGIQSSLNQTPYVTAGFSATATGLGLHVGLPHQNDWVPEHREYYFGPAGAGRGPALPETKETLFTLSTYRNFSEMWLRSGDLFGDQTNDEFAKADANLTTFFAGRDFGEDILGSMQPEVGFVAVRNDLSDQLPRPTIKVPAFALVMKLREPETMTRELRRIFQSLVGFLNVVGAQNGQNQLELDMEKLDGGVQLLTSTFVPEEDDRESTQAKIIFNFSPSIAFAGNRFVVSSTKSLARELITAPQPSQTAIQDNTQAILRADALRNLLHDNRNQLIAQNMLEDGNSRQEAEAFIDLLLTVVGYFDNASVRLGNADGRLDVELQIQLAP